MAKETCCRWALELSRGSAGCALLLPGSQCHLSSPSWLPVPEGRSLCNSRRADGNLGLPQIMLTGASWDSKSLWPNTLDVETEPPRTTGQSARACQKHSPRQNSSSFNTSNIGQLLRAHVSFGSTCTGHKYFTTQMFNSPSAPPPKHTKGKPYLQAPKSVCSQCPTPCPVTFCLKCH